VPELRRGQLHARAADTLRLLDPPPLGQVAAHLRNAGRTDAWVDAAERAADQALAVGNDAQAIRLLEEVLRDAPLAVDRAGVDHPRLTARENPGARHPLRTRDGRQPG
jgi:hypothetical protein